MTEGRDAGPGLHPVGVGARYIVLGAGVGALVGVLWALLAPRVVASSLDPPQFVEAYPQGFAVTDLILGSLLLTSGVVIGVVAARRLRHTSFVGGWVHVVGCVAACLMCAAMARVTGWWIAGRVVSPQADGEFTLPITVGANGVLLLGVFGALLIVLFYAAFARDDSGL